jgi:hypothetical protein
MLQSYFPIYKIALKLEELRRTAEVLKTHKISLVDSDAFHTLLETIKRECPGFGFSHTSDMANRILIRPRYESYSDMFSDLTHLNDSLSYELEKELVFRIPPERKDYFERNDLFGPEVSTAFPSCAMDIQKAGSCYAVGQEDACVHHLMLVLERGLHALADKTGVSNQQANWQLIINEIEKKLKSLPRSPDLDFYRQVNAQFGFLKDAYRNHSQHAHDDPYDMEKALSILNHVRSFMQALAKGGLSE